MSEHFANPLKGVIQKILSVLLIVLMMTCVKSAGDVPLGEIMFFRAFLSVFPIIAVLQVRGTLRSALHTNRPLGHLLRTVVGLSSMGLVFFAIRTLPLPEAVTLQYTQPLLLVAFSAVFIGERVGMSGWMAVLLGLVGVLVITWPSLTVLSGSDSSSRLQLLGAAAAILAAATYAWTVLLVRQLVRTESSETIVMWFCIFSSLLLLSTSLFGWKTLSLEQTALLVASGVLGGFGQLLMTESVRHAAVSTTAPLEYTSIVFVTLIAYISFDDVPGFNTMLGGLLVVLAGLMIIWRERRIESAIKLDSKLAPPH
jgi:drug/metabolite transporter (DMT)-like permease